MDHNTWTDQLADFLQFLSDAQHFLRQNQVSKRHPDVQSIRSTIEENYRDDSGQPAKYQKYESAFYEDAPTIVTLWDFFKKYDGDQLRHYHKLIMLELGGLTGDQHPMSILGRSVFGMAALLMSSVTVWWGLIKLISEDDPGNWLSELFQSFLSPAMINRIVGVIWLVGMILVIWYVLRMIRNRKQVAFLSSLNRALDLYLNDDASRSKREC